MKASNNAVKLIAQFEGFESKPYICSGGVVTIGYGTTIYPSGVKVNMNDSAITKQQAEEYLLNDINKFSNGVDLLVRKNINQNQFDALVSFAYNVGLGNLSNSTLLKLINVDPNNSLIKNEFIKWNKAKGKVLAGLTRRRNAEANLYFKP